MSYKCYHVNESLNVTNKIEIGKYKLKNSIEIDAVLVGEKGRGRKLGVLPVQLLHNWTPNIDQNGIITNPKDIIYCSIGKTTSGFPKLIECEMNNNINGIILQVTPPLYYRGGGSYTWSPQEPEILVSGTIAQGMAGYMGSINHYVYKIESPCECLLQLNGRSYGEPTDYKIKINNNWEVSCLSLEEEKLL